MTISVETRRTLAMICAILFVPALAFALVTTNLEKSLFNAATYKDALKTAQVYDRLAPLIASEIVGSATQQGGLPAAVVGALPADTVQKLLVSVLPADKLQGMVESGVDQALAYVNGKSNQSEISLADLRGLLTANSGSLVDKYFQALPDCTLADALSVAQGLLGGGADLPKCNPPAAVREAISGPLQAAVQQELGQVLPGNLSLTSGGGALVSLFSALRWLRTAARLTPLIAIFLFAGMTLLAVRTARELLAWWGWPLLSAGLLGLLAGLVIGPAATTLLDLMIIGKLSASIGAGLVLLMKDVAAAVAAGLAGPILLDAAVVAALGGALLLFLRFGPRDALEKL